MFKYFYLIFVLTLIGCGATVEPPSPITITITSADNTVQLARHLGDAFAQTRPHLSFEVNSANAVRSLEQLAIGKADLVFTTYLLPDAKQFQQIPIARDGVAIIVHPDNPINNLTLLELQQLYRAKIFNWRDIGGKNEDVQVVIRESGAGIGQVFKDTIMEGQAITPNARIFPNSQGILNFVAQTPQAIGYISLAYIAENETSETIKIATIEEILPTQETLSNNAYPLSYFLYVLTVPNSQATPQTFSKFLVQPAAQQIVTAHNFGRIK